jgi:hypothetical protein
MHENVLWRPLIEEISQDLRALHATLLALEREAYVRRHGPITNTQLLGLLLNDPTFAWMRGLSKLMADVDSLLDQPQIEDADAAAVRLELDRLFTNSPPFSTEYLQRLHENPTLAMDHGRAREVMSRLPDAAVEDQADLLHRRHAWREATKHKHRTKDS